MNRALFSLLLLLVFTSCQKERKQQSKSIQAVPIDAAIIIESENISKSLNSLTSSSMWKDLISETSLEVLNQNIYILDSTLATYASHLNSINPVFLSVHLTGAQSLNWLLISSTEGQEQKVKLLDLGLQSFSEIKNHHYSNTTITEILLEGSSTFYTIHKGLAIISPEKILIEDAIRQLKTPNNLVSNKHFDRLFQSANKKEDFNLYINCKQFDKLSTSFSNENADSYKHAEWIQWDLDINKQGLLFSGLSLAYDSLSQQLSFYSGNEGHSILAPKVLPKNTAAFKSMAFENFKQYQRKQKTALEYSHKKIKYEQNIRALADSNRQAFESWIDSEICWFLTENSQEINAALALHISSEAETETYLTEKVDSIILYREMKIYKWEQLRYYPLLLNISSSRNFEYACILNEELIVTADAASLKNIINDYLAEKTLEHNGDYQKCLDELGTKSNFFIYLQNPSALSLVEQVLDIDNSEFFTLYKEPLNKFRAFAVQFKADGEHIYSNAYLHYDDKEVDQTRAIWTKELKAPILSEISLVKNHYNQQWEIVVQDEKLNLYLISPEGEILWERKLDGAIIGSIQQIDLLKNRKLQLLFNTANKIYLIDRKGRNVNNYPINLAQKTELPLALFDYDKNRNYRILISSGKRHFMYNKNGGLIKGWAFKKSKSKAALTAKHFVVAGKDYILIPEENGKLNILNRKGEERIKVEGKIDFSNNDIYVVKGANLAETRIVTVDKNGLQQNILFNGSIDNSLQLDYNSNIHFSYQHNHTVLVEENNLKVNGPEMNLRYSFENENLGVPRLFKESEELYLSILDIESTQSYLFRSTGELMDGFPLYGNNSAQLKDLDLDGKLNYIVAGEDGSLYNYAAE